MEGVDELVKRMAFHAGVGATVKPGSAWDKKALEVVVHQLTSGAPRDDLAWLRGMFTEAYFKSRILHYFLPAKAVMPGDI